MKEMRERSGETRRWALRVEMSVAFQVPSVCSLFMVPDASAQLFCDRASI